MVWREKQIQRTKEDETDVRDMCNRVQTLIKPYIQKKYPTGDNCNDPSAKFQVARTDRYLLEVSHTHIIMEEIEGYSSVHLGDNSFDIYHHYRLTLNTPEGANIPREFIDGLEMAVGLEVTTQ